MCKVSWHGMDLHLVLFDTPIELCGLKHFKVEQWREDWWKQLNFYKPSDTKFKLLVLSHSSEWVECVREKLEGWTIINLWGAALTDKSRPLDDKNTRL